jgi:hypothetical protein
VNVLFQFRGNLPAKRMAVAGNAWRSARYGAQGSTMPATEKNGGYVTLMKYLPHKMATLPLTQPGMNHEISS